MTHLQRLEVSSLARVRRESPPRLWVVRGPRLDRDSHNNLAHFDPCCHAKHPNG
jgi:hypothetical protein